MCDDHPDVPAVARVQGETDSFGCEMYDVCQVCLDEIKSYKPEPAACDWCGKVAKLSPQRDYDEGMCGRVYDVCSPCIEVAEAELNEYEYSGYRLCKK